MAYADFEFYTTEYGGKAIAEEDFPGLSNRAALYIDIATSKAAARATGDKLYMVKMANCAVAEVFQDEDRLNVGTFSTEAQVSSETVGSWSRSYSSKTATAVHLELLSNRKRSALELYLGPLGLLKVRPVKRCCR